MTGQKGVFEVGKRKDKGFHRAKTQFLRKGFTYTSILSLYFQIKPVMSTLLFLFSREWNCDLERSGNLSKPIP